MAKRYFGSYEGKEGKESQESRDGGMMPSGAGQFANMPQSVVHVEYPKEGNWMPEDLDDSIRGVDRQVGEDKGKRSLHLKPKKV